MCLKLLENLWWVLEFRSCKFWNFAFVDNFEASTCMHATSTWWVQYSTFSVTLQCKFWKSASSMWLFVDNFGAWKMQFGSLKVFEKCLNFVLWVCYEPCVLPTSLTANEQTVWQTTNSHPCTHTHTLSPLQDNLTLPVWHRTFDVLHTTTTTTTTV